MERLQLVSQPARREGDRAAIVPTPHPQGDWQVWERPRVGCRYLLSVRPGGGWKLVGGQRARERTVVLVLRRGFDETGANEARDWQPHRLVARLVPVDTGKMILDPTPLAARICLLAEWYGDALCFVDVSPAPGAMGPVLAREVQRLGGAVQQREEFDEVSEKWVKKLGWLTNEETAAVALNSLMNGLREYATPGSKLGVRVECEHALRELEHFVPADSATPAARHDDDVRGLATAVLNIDAASMYHAETRARRPPADGWRVGESFGVVREEAFPEQRQDRAEL